jgi:hypothetical protein
MGNKSHPILSLYFIPFDAIQFPSIPFYSILFTPFHFILIHSVQFHSIPFHSIIFHSISFFSILLYSNLFHFIIFHLIPMNSISVYSIPVYSISFNSILFHSNQLGFICRFPSNFQKFQLQYCTFYMLFISLLRVITKNFESIGLISPQYSVLKNKSADVSIIFERLQKLCYTQNLVKHSWLRLRRDFISDIKRNLNILAQTRLYFSI